VPGSQKEVDVSESEKRDEQQRRVARRLNHLFEHVHPPDRGPFIMKEVAEATGISISTIQQMRTGKKTNPTMSTLEALAGFFGVSPQFFFSDDEAAEREVAQIEVLAALRDSTVVAIAQRASGLSPDGLRQIRDMLDYVRHREGLPQVADPQASADI
jgi:transcriptional regulator with XRE-family HTH domain